MENIYSLTAPGYYEVTVKMPDGTRKVLKVTGEHPLYVKKGTEETTTAVTTETSPLQKLHTSLSSIFSRIKDKLLKILAQS